MNGIDEKWILLNTALVDIFFFTVAQWLIGVALSTFRQWISTIHFP